MELASIEKFALEQTVKNNGHQLDMWDNEMTEVFEYLEVVGLVKFAPHQKFKKLKGVYMTSKGRKALGK